MNKYSLVTFLFCLGCLITTGYFLTVRFDTLHIACFIMSILLMIGFILNNVRIKKKKEVKKK